MTSSNSPASFSSLPFELLRQIWNYTFEARTLSVFFHEQELPRDTADVQVWATHFTVRRGLHVDPLSPTTLQHHNHASSLTPQITYLNQDLLLPWMRIKHPPGPVAAHVCASSRAIALEEYQLYLAGSVYPPNRSGFDAVFAQSGHGSPHAWISPRLDLVFLAGMCNWHIENISPVDSEFFHWRCEVESARFQRVAVMSHSFKSQSRLLSTFRNYAALKELVVFATRSGNRASRGGEPGRMAASDKQIALGIEDFMTWMKQSWEENGGLCGGSWAAEIPMVRVFSNVIRWNMTDQPSLLVDMELELVAQ